MKTVYFVRHGESEGNIAPIYQSTDPSLTEKGKQQARIVAERCSRLPIQAIISSTQLRAKDTANIIGETTGHTVEFSDLFRERRKPKALNGKPFSDPEAQALNGKWWKSLMGEGPRAEDGENFEDILTRAGKALAYLIQRPEKNLLVVTHGFYMKYLVAKAIYGGNLTGPIFSSLAGSLIMENTGITVLRHGSMKDPERWGEYGPWQFWIWNDHAHLG
ncbi:hypothetical protein A3C86_04355 [Candidatus Kaiserbacteria bacterium RIFCSPHIGHO2_02_FULL_49_16]|uniref:Phosphoglycerate mutase n=1 Tax=Candidatus Kaiserbacteria bacterium RIFCSPHIGHO2_02_FULL_49_16 TaxID=1798490 RepID=A0A1F6DAN4_9BACT|nr:MAG: hypothetical protein A3C86_04355 [Candidatus Kaiserbacteria bacterium RIFCSPHIGHO2_02_FULL_49_16]